ncbi:hypothetical protein CPB86DRAFT_778798 [Serendipita vermifera]|nr:hypothetical protein CPB86DRAFT_778798 [Serendipita vermifera]
MRERECRINELQARIQPRSAQYIRHASKGTISDKDSQILERIQADYDLIKQLSNEKILKAQRLRDLLTKHSNRLAVELAKITNPGELVGKPVYTPVIPTGTTSTTQQTGAITATQSDSATFNASTRTPMTGVVSSLKTDAASNGTTAVPTAPVPIVLEPASVTVSAAPSPASAAPPTKRRRLNATQNTSSAQQATTPAPTTAAPPRSSGPRPTGSAASLAPSAPTTGSVPSTPSARPRRQASAAAQISPAPNTTASRNMSESTTMSSATTGGEKEDVDMPDDVSSTGDGGDGGADDDADGDGDDGPYCVCQEKSYGEMIGCDNGSDCPYQWFHVACVHVQKPLPNTWFCDYCTKKLGFADNTGATVPSTNSERSTRKRRR